MESTNFYLHEFVGLRNTGGLGETPQQRHTTETYNWPKYRNQKEALIRYKESHLQH